MKMALLASRSADLDRARGDHSAGDEFIFERKQRAPGLIEIDVEGTEWQVLQGAYRTPPCEVHDGNGVRPILSFVRDFSYHNFSGSIASPNGG